MTTGKKYVLTEEGHCYAKEGMPENRLIEILEPETKIQEENPTAQGYLEVKDEEGHTKYLTLDAGLDALQEKLAAGSGMEEINALAAAAMGPELREGSVLPLTIEGTSVRM